MSPNLALAGVLAGNVGMVAASSIAAVVALPLPALAAAFAALATAVGGITAIRAVTRDAEEAHQLPTDGLHRPAYRHAA